MVHFFVSLLIAEHRNLYLRFIKPILRSTAETDGKEIYGLLCDRKMKNLRVDTYFKRQIDERSELSLRLMQAFHINPSPARLEKLLFFWKRNDDCLSDAITSFVFHPDCLGIY